jgi:hypothetical protein
VRDGRRDRPRPDRRHGSCRLNFGDPSASDDPIFQTRADGDDSDWRLSTDHAELEDDTRETLEHELVPNTEVTGTPMTWTHPSGQIAVQFETRDDRPIIFTVPFIPPAV